MNLEKFVEVFMLFCFLVIPMTLLIAWIFGYPVGYVWQGWEFVPSFGVGVAFLVVVAAAHQE